MKSPSTHPLMLIAGNSNPELWEEISENLGIPLTKALVSRFSDGEIRVQVEQCVRYSHCFILHSTCAPVNANLM